MHALNKFGVFGKKQIQPLCETNPLVPIHSAGHQHEKKRWASRGLQKAGDYHTGFQCCCKPTNSPKKLQFVRQVALTKQSYYYCGGFKNGSGTCFEFGKITCYYRNACRMCSPSHCSHHASTCRAYLFVEEIDKVIGTMGTQGGSEWGKKTYFT